jgi:AcrR family transcriptional regulator
MPKACQKDLVLETARTLILADGYDGVTVRRIAREAGLTTGAIYSNYRNKAEILGILLMEAWDELRSSILERVSLESDLRRRLRLFFTGYKDFSLRFPQEFSLIMYVGSHPEVFAELGEQRQLEVLSRQAELVNRMVELVDEMKQRGCLIEVDSPTYVVALISTANGLLESRSRSLHTQYNIEMDRVDDLVMGQLIDRLCPAL